MQLSKAKNNIALRKINKGEGESLCLRMLLHIILNAYYF